MELQRNCRWQSHLNVMIFCLLIGSFTAVSLIKPPAEFSETENRVLAQMPSPTIQTIRSGEFEKDYEEYLNDQFFLRDDWIGLKTSVERLLLRRESKDIYFAEDGYLIEKHTGAFSSDTAARNARLLADFVRQYQESFEDGRLFVMLIPTAADILRDRLPPFAPPSGQRAYLELLADTLPAGVWFDAAAVLRQHSREELYYRTDHHWKTLAAFYVYQAWWKTQGNPMPTQEDYDIVTAADDFEGTIQSKLGIKTDHDTIQLFLPKHPVSYIVQKDRSEELLSDLYDYQALNTKDKYAVYFGGNYGFLKISTESDNGRKLLVIKDSYASCFLPFLIGEFQEIDVVDLRYTSQRLSHLIAENSYTDLLVLYNAAGFAEDISISRLTR